MGIASCCEEKSEISNRTVKRISRHNSAIAPYFKQSTPFPDSTFLSPENHPRKKVPCTKDVLSPAKTAANPGRREQAKKRGPQEFQHLRYLGKGAFGCVVLVQQKSSGKKFAMKIIQKNKIKEFNLLQCERIRNIGHEEFFVAIKQTFQNNNNIYIVMEYLSMGDLYYYLRKNDSFFTQQAIVTIVAEIVVSIGFLHQQGIIYRQLKPENLLVTDQGHLKLTDYGLSKVIVENRKSISTFVGTLEYMAPEAYSGDFGQKADIWSIGILMFELFFKDTLFQLDDSSLTDILKEGPFPIQSELIESRINSRVGFMSLRFRDILLRLLEQDPDKRFDLPQIKAHEFFRGIDWAQVQGRRNHPPLKELLHKKSMIKFRDPTAEKYYRKEYVKERSLKENYQIELYQFRKSQ